MPSLIQPYEIQCPTFILGARGYSICLPGGACLSGQVQDRFASPDEICNALLAQLQVALTPFKSIFDLVGIVQCLKDVLELAPGIASGPSGIQDFTDALTSCVVKIDDLATMIPQLSVPIFLAQALDLIICVLDGILTELQEVIVQAVKIEALNAKAAGPQDPIFNVVECANRLNSNRMCAINESMGPLNSLLELLNIFLKLIGMDPLPTMGEMGSEASQALATFREFILILKQVRALLGIPVTPLIPRC